MTVTDVEENDDKTLIWYMLKDLKKCEQLADILDSDDSTIEILDAGWKYRFFM